MSKLSIAIEIQKTATSGFSINKKDFEKIYQSIL